MTKKPEHYVRISITTNQRDQKIRRIVYMFISSNFVVCTYVSKVPSY